MPYEYGSSAVFVTVSSSIPVSYPLRCTRTNLPTVTSHLSEPSSSSSSTISFMTEPKMGISETSPLTAASITETEKKKVATASSMLTTIPVITPASAPLPTDFALFGRLSS